MITKISDLKMNTCSFERHFIIRSGDAMYISEQLLNPDERRLRLSTQLGVKSVVLDNRGTELVSARGGVSEWDTAKLAEYRKWVEGFGLKLDVFALDVGSILLDSLVDLDSAKRQRATLADNIQKAADAGITCLKYNVQMVGITRTGLKPGRGGAKNSGFVFAEYSPEDDRKHSYWGVGYPSNQEEGGSESTMLCGQKMARDVPPVTKQAGWDAIEFLVEGLVPAADKAGVRLACHPHDPAYPVGGLNGIEHVVGSADGLRRFLALSPSKNHGLNFCQGTVAEMFTQPAIHMIPVIEEFASTGRIFMVHFRNIRGGYLDFREVFPDEGDVDMLQAIKAYQRGGYAGPLCPDHVPVSDIDEGRERFMAFALGYTRGLLQAAGVWSAPGG
ncbi:mannonate dehydratase [Achromobacter spanius]|uniref:mannonate dehydratase n=1 Tax=Achromobacter spanius TaxID=217203 RepID=UPI0038044AB4